MIIDKYKPTTQKMLFHKDIINHILKWVKLIKDNFDNNKTVKEILFIHGPIGCGKSVTIECLFKAYNLITIDCDILRSNDKTSEILESIVGFSDITLSNIDKWNHKNKREKSNIVLIDNIELCDKGIDSFVDNIHKKNNINVPVILICNHSKYKDNFVNFPNCTFIEFKKPSLLELSKLIIDVNTNEKLTLTKENIKTVFEKSQADIRQLFFIIDQWMLSKQIGITFDNFIDTLELKQVDQDFSEKMQSIFDSSPFNLKSTFHTVSAESHVLSNGIYQNYISMTGKNPQISLDKTQMISVLDNFTNIMDSISYSDIINNEIYSNQQWGLYNDYTFTSCVLPSYYIKKNSNIYNHDIKTKYTFLPFKDFSYNFINSYDEVKKICKLNLYNNKINPNGNKLAIYTISNPIDCFTIGKMFITCIIQLNTYFDQNKRGKNTTKKEKLDLCNNIIIEPYKNALDILTSSIYEYKLFEAKINDDISIYNNDLIIKENINIIDLRVFKRFLNIFTFDDSHKLFKSNIEISIQYKILQLLVSDLQKQTIKTINNIHSVEELTQNLDEIWNF